MKKPEFNQKVTEAIKDLLDVINSNDPLFVKGRIMSVRHDLQQIFDELDRRPERSYFTAADVERVRK